MLNLLKKKTFNFKTLVLVFTENACLIQVYVCTFRRKYLIEVYFYGSAFLCRFSYLKTVYPNLLLFFFEINVSMKIPLFKN